MKRIIVLFLYFISGFCALLYELIWMRKLALVFGSTTLATSSILTAFMAGLALGSYLFGKISDRTQNNLLLYAKLELGIAVSGFLLLFFMVPISNFLYVQAYPALQQNLGMMLFRFAVSFLLLIIPTTLMGGTFPVMTRFFVKEANHFGSRLGLLYGLNTLGGIAGAFVTGFFLIRAFGENHSLLIAIVANFVVAGVAWLLTAKRETASAIPKRSHVKDATKPKADARILQNSMSIYSEKTGNKVLWLFALAGFTSLAYEVVWTRALIFFVSSTTYSFTLILVTFLSGITIGAFLVAKWIDRSPHLIKIFALLQTGIGISAILSLPLLTHMVAIQQKLYGQIQVQNWLETTAVLFITCSLVLLVPAIFMGAIFPIAQRIYVRSMSSLGAGVGRVYMFNTVGAIFGSFSGGFILLQFFGLQTSLLILCSLNLLIGWLVFRLQESKGRSFVMLQSAGSIIFVVLVFFFYSNKPLFTDVISFKNTRILFAKDTAPATIHVLEQKEEVNIWGRPVRYININGHNTAHTTFSDIIIHKLLAHLPMLLHPQSRDALVIGYGFGNTCHSFLRYELQRLDCVELLEIEKATSIFFASENEGVLQDPRFHYIVNDGRNHVLANPQSYDVISINAVDPRFSPSLYTEEFYGLCKKRLNPDGLIVAWLPIYGMTELEIKALVSSFIRTFPNASLWYNNPEHFLLLGSMKPLAIDYPALEKAMAQPPVRKSLQQIHLADPASFLATFFMDENDLQDWVGTAPPHTDDLPLVEFSRVTTVHIEPELYPSLLRRKSSAAPLCRGLAPADERRQTLSLYDRAMEEMLNGLFLYRTLQETVPADSTLMRRSRQWMRSSLDAAPDNLFNLLYYVDWVYHPDPLSEARYFAKAVEAEPGFAKAYVLHGLALAEGGDPRAALEQYQNALKINPDFAAAHFNSGVVWMQLQAWPQAIQAFHSVLQRTPENMAAQSNLSQVYYMNGELGAAIKHALIALEFVPNKAHAWFNLGMMYEKNLELEKAISAFQAGIRLAPSDTRAAAKLEDLQHRLKSL